MVKTIRYSTFCLIFVCFFNVIAIAQDRLGIVGSNYAGSQSVTINPSNILNSKLYMDINLLLFDVSLQNNYLYIPKNEYSLGQFIEEIDRNIDYSNEHGGWMPHDEMDFKETPYKHGKDVFTFTNATVMGPSAMYAINDHAFGFYSAFRNYVNLQNIPFEIANFAYWGIDFEEQLNMQYTSSDYSGAAASWLELGFTYARVLNKSYNKHLSGGITVKRLLSYAASFIDVDKLNYKVDLDVNAIVDESDFRFGYALPLDYRSNQYIDKLKVFGRGWAFDLGFTYQLKTRGYEISRYKKACEQEFEPYILKLGVSLLDIGTIKYKDNARVHEYSGTMLWESIDDLDFYSMDQFTSDLSSHYYGDPNASLSDTTFNIGLPTTLSVQADYHYYKNIYLGGLIMLPVQLYKYQIRRPSLIAFMPRYETPRFEVSTPISFYDFNELRLGFSVRYGFFTLGTDKLGAIMGFNNFDGFDIYCTIKFNFLKGKCANKFINVCRN